jgi:hypothetical protein
MAALLANVPVHPDRSTVTPTTPVNGDKKSWAISPSEDARPATTEAVSVSWLARSRSMDIGYSRPPGR